MAFNMWEFTVKEGHQEEFVRMNEQDWPNLFKKSPSYRGTEVIPFGTNPPKYITTDEWKSIDDFKKFREEYESEFDELDMRHKEHYTEAKDLGWST